MEKKYLWLLVAMLLLAMPLLAACAAPAEEAPATETPAVEEPADEGASAASIARGGTLYDKWWKVAEGASEPTEDMPLWATQSTNTRSGSTTWRCKECHGWDYKGIEGAYSSGSHSTGFTGVYDAANSKTGDQLLAIMKGGNNADHDFSKVMNDASLGDIINLLKEGLIDDSKYIDYETKGAIGADLANGETLYNKDCASCHGDDGWMIQFGDDGMANLANGNPWEVLHKIRFGQPASTMPAGVTSGWSTQDAVDVLGYAQTLPEEQASEEPAAEEPAVSGPPAIPHDLEGRDDCLMCHAEGGLKPFPADHAGRTSDTCQACHQPAG